MFLIAVRLSSTWLEYREFRREICENITHAHHTDVEGRSLRNWVILYTVFCVTLEVFCVGSTLAFHFTGNLDWTVLVNQFCLIVILSTSGLLMSRIELALVRKTEDELKTIIHEGALILHDVISARTPQELGQGQKTGSEFLRALEKSDNLALPGYITLAEGEGTKHNTSALTSNDESYSTSTTTNSSFTGMKQTSL